MHIFFFSVLLLPHCSSGCGLLSYFKLLFSNDQWCWSSFHILIRHSYIFFHEITSQIPFSFCILVFGQKNSSSLSAMPTMTKDNSEEWRKDLQKLSRSMTVTLRDSLDILVIPKLLRTCSHLKTFCSQATDCFLLIQSTFVPFESHIYICIYIIIYILYYICKISFKPRYQVFYLCIFCNFIILPSTKIVMSI